MTRRAAPAGLVVAALALLVPAAPAVADDASLFAAYDSKQPRALDKVVRSYVRHVRRFDRSHNRHRRRRWARATIRDDRRMNRVLTGIRRGIAGEEASSEGGKRAKSFALKEIDAWRRANRLEVRSLRAWIHGRRHRSRRLLLRASRIMRRQTYPYGNKAVDAFLSAGFASENGALSA